MKAYLFRKQQTSVASVGHLFLMEGDLVVAEFATVELPWKNNESGKSCIPAGTYLVKKHTSPKFGACYKVSEVPNRTDILLHSANYSRELLGCIGIGTDHADIDKDGTQDITASKAAMERLLKVGPESFTMTIFSAAV